MNIIYQMKEKKELFWMEFSGLWCRYVIARATLQSNRLTIRRCTKFVVSHEPQKPWGWDKFLMQEYVVLDIFCFCSTMLPTREVGEKNQDHVRHSVRLDPSYVPGNRMVRLGTLYGSRSREPHWPKNREKNIQSLRSKTHAIFFCHHLYSKHYITFT